MSGAASSPGAWPRSAVVAGLGTVAVVTGSQEVLRPDWTPHTAPGLLAATTFAIGLLVLRHGRGRDPLAAMT